MGPTSTNSIGSYCSGLILCYIPVSDNETNGACWSFIFLIYKLRGLLDSLQLITAFLVKI